MTALLLPRLRHREDRRTLGFMACQLTALGLAWTGICRNGLLLAACYPLAFICCIISHNQMHVPTFRGRTWNSLFQLLLMFGSGQPPTGIVTVHNDRHHGDPGSDGDFVRPDLVNFRANVWNLLVFPFASIADMYRRKPSDFTAWRKARPRLYRQALIERAVFYGVMIVLLILDWRATLLFLVSPWLAGQILLVGINLLQHQDCELESEWNHSRNLTGKGWNFFFLNNGFHTAHHLRPGLHWSKLADYHRLQVAPHLDPSLDHPGLAGLLLERLSRPPHESSRN